MQTKLLAEISTERRIIFKWILKEISCEDVCSVEVVQERQERVWQYLL